MFIRYRTNHTWIGGGSSIVSRPWVVYQFTVGEEDQPDRPVLNSVVQERDDKLKINFVNGATVSWGGAATNGVTSTFQPLRTRFHLLDELGRIIKLHLSLIHI